MMLLLLVIAGVDPSYTLSLRNELRARRATTYDDASRPWAMDLEVQPNLLGVLDIDHIARPALSYTPRFVLRQIDGGARGVRPALLHNASLNIPVRLTRLLTLTLREDASYGVADYASLSGITQQTGRVDSVLVGAQVATASLRSTAGLSARLARRQTLDAAVYHSYVAGIGDAGLLSTPPQRAFGALAQYNWQLARHWRAGATGDGTYTLFTNGPRIGVIEAGARVGWLYEANAELSLTAGSAVVHFETWRSYPYARLGLTHQFNAPSGRWQLALAAQMLPFVDRFAASVYERLETGGTVTYTPNIRVSLRGQGQWTLALFDPVYGGQQLAVLDLAVLYRAVRHVTFDAGGRLLYLRQVGNLPQQPLQWLAYVGVAFDVTDG